MRSSTKVFHLRGGIDYKKLGIVHRAMMAMLKTMMTGKKPREEWTDEQKLLIDTYGDRVDFTDRRSINPIVEYIRKLG